MTSFISVIIWFIIFLAIVNKLKNFKGDGASAKPNVPRSDKTDALRQYYENNEQVRQKNISQADRAYQQRQQDRAAYAQSRNGAVPGAAANAARAKTPAPPLPMTQAAGAKTAAQAPKPAAAGAPQIDGGKSTTQILHEKAMRDEAEHRREKLEQERENRRIHGNLNYAQRLWLGDPVPKGKRLVLCGYCNAENLVPAHDFTTKYNCYFCREIL